MSQPTWAELFSRGEQYRKTAERVREIHQELVDLHQLVPDEIIDDLAKTEKLLFDVAVYAGQRHASIQLEAKRLR